MDLHEIQLSVGDVTSTVEVRLRRSTWRPTVRTARLRSACDRSRTRRRAAAIRSALIMTLPGVQTVVVERLSRLDRRRHPGVNGGQTGQIILNMDGAASQDSGNLNPGYISPSVDAIGEVKLLVSNYTAEYGGRTGGQLTFTTKNGTPQFHGSGLLLLAP